MLEISVHKKMQIVKLLTGSDDCALRVFDGDSGHLMKVIPVQARVLCGFIAWQKIYIGLKSGTFRHKVDLHKTKRKVKKICSICFFFVLLE